MASHAGPATQTEIMTVMWDAFNAGQFELAWGLTKKIPTNGRAKTIQAVLAWREGQDELAKKLACKAVIDRPSDPEVLQFYARIQMEIGDKEAALEAYFRLLELDRSTQRAIDLGLALLFCGHFAQGWAVYDSRVPMEMARMGLTASSLWAGDKRQPLQVLHEGGFGDTIQFCRFLKHSEMEGADLTLRVPKALVRLLAHNFPEARFIDTPNPAMQSVLMMSLARICRIGKPSAVPGGRYLSAPKPPLHILGLQGHLPICGSALKVGICWGGSPNAPRDSLRSLTKAHLRRLTTDLPVDWVSLQLGPHLADWPEEVPIQRPELGDFLDTAQVMEELDLILTVDTSVAHLAGALGHPAWVLVPSVPDFRWAPGSQWYDSTQILRQPRPGDWIGVINAVRERLTQLMQNKEARYAVKASAAG